MVRRFYRKALDILPFFLQKKDQKKLLQQLGNNVAVSGDTRFDRVAAILDKDNTLDYISQFKMILNHCCREFWPKDEALIVDFINQHTELEIHYRSS
jgi:3-deoxy-D-manno-octulosonic-acid transferase